MQQTEGILNAAFFNCTGKTLLYERMKVLTFL